MTTLAVHKSSARTKTGKDGWQTPPETVRILTGAFGSIGLDPCDTLACSTTNAVVRMLESGLTARWFDLIDPGRLIYVNPPYSQLREWLGKCAAEAADPAIVEAGVHIVALIAARTDTRAWHESVSTARAICLWRGRITFHRAPSCAPFPSAFVYWGPRPHLFADAFADHGMMVMR